MLTDRRCPPHTLQNFSDQCFYETMILREKVCFKKAPILDLGKGFQIIIDFKSWNLEYETQKLPFYKQNL
jgi:hypothetical protein